MTAGVSDAPSTTEGLVAAVLELGPAAGAVTDALTVIARALSRADVDELAAFCADVAAGRTDATTAARQVPQVPVDGRTRRKRRARIVGPATEELLEQYRADCEQRGVMPRSIVKLWSVLACVAEDVHPTPLLDATAAQITAALDSRSLVPRTRYGYLSALHGFYRWAIDQDLTTADPTSRIRRPKSPRHVPRPLPDADLRHALPQAPPDLKAMMLLGAYQGLRCQEIAGLTREDILEHNDPPVMIVTAGKGGHERVLPLHPDTMAALRVHGLPRAGHVFVEPGTTRPIPPHRVSHRVGRYLRSVGVNGTAHQLRHWFATKVYAENQDLRVTQELLGHASPNTTTVYAAYSVADARRAVENLHI